METFRERLQKLVEQAVPTTKAGKGKHTVFARKAGISIGTMDRIYNKDQFPKVEDILKIIQVTGCSADWLLTGEGEMLRSDVNRAALSHNVEPYPPETQDLIGKVAEIMQSGDPVVKSHLQNAVSAFWEATLHHRKMARLEAGIDERDRKLEKLERDMEALKKIVSPGPEGVLNEEKKT